MAGAETGRTIAFSVKDMALQPLNASNLAIGVPITIDTLDTAELKIDVTLEELRGGAYLLPIAADVKEMKVELSAKLTDMPYAAASLFVAGTYSNSNPPTVAPTGTPAAGGALTAGTYTLEYTWLTKDGFETGPSPVSGNVVLSGGNLQISVGAVTPPGWVQAVRWYFASGPSTGFTVQNSTGAAFTLNTAGNAVGPPAATGPRLDPIGDYNVVGTTVGTRLAVGPVASPAVTSDFAVVATGAQAYNVYDLNTGKFVSGTTVIGGNTDSTSVPGVSLVWSAGTFNVGDVANFHIVNIGGAGGGFTAEQELVKGPGTYPVTPPQVRITGQAQRRGTIFRFMLYVCEISGVALPMGQGKYVVPDFKACVLTPPFGSAFTESYRLDYVA